MRVAEREAHFERGTKEIVRRPFDLSVDLMLRAALFRMSDNDHRLLLVIHHIATDGRSEDILVREFGIFYRAFSTDQIPDLPELPFRYVDFVQWQRSLIQGQFLQDRVEYWKNRFRAIPHLELPRDYGRPTVQEFHGSAETEMITKTLTNDLRKLSRQEGVTLFMTLLAGFQVLLFRLTGQDDIVVGSPIAGRKRSEFDSLMGFFVNTLVLRTDLSGNPSFREALGRVRDVALGAYDHQEVPFEMVMSDLGLAGSLSRNTLFQVMFAFRKDPLEQDTDRNSQIRSQHRNI